MIDIYLDAPLPNADLARLTHPKVKITNCDRAYWEATGKSVMENTNNAKPLTPPLRTAHRPWTGWPTLIAMNLYL